MKWGEMTRGLQPGPRAAACALLIAVLATFGCANADTERDIELVSKHDTTKSHYPDSNCMGCHQPNDRLTEDGLTPGFFTLAGTLQEADGTRHRNGVVILYDAAFDKKTGTSGKELMRLEADGRGMFYTTRALPKPHPEAEQYRGYFPAVLDTKTGAIKHMSFGTDSGACNHCHTGRVRDTSPRDDLPGDPWHQDP